MRGQVTPVTPPHRRSRYSFADGSKLRGKPQSCGDDESLSSISRGAHRSKVHSVSSPSQYRKQKATSPENRSVWTRQSSEQELRSWSMPAVQEIASIHEMERAGEMKPSWSCQSSFTNRALSTWAPRSDSRASRTTTSRSLAVRSEATSTGPSNGRRAWRQRLFSSVFMWADRNAKCSNIRVPKGNPASVHPELLGCRCTLVHRPDQLVYQ